HATVLSITGQAWIRQPDGSLTFLQKGSRVPEGARIVTSPDGTVELAVDGQPPVGIGNNRDGLFDIDKARPADHVSAASVGRPRDPDSARLLNSLLDDAAGFGSGEGEGQSEAGAQDERVSDAGNRGDAGGGDASNGGHGGHGGGSGVGDGGSNFVHLAPIVERTVPLDLDYPDPGFDIDVADRWSGLPAASSGALEPQSQSSIELDAIDGDTLPGHDALASNGTVTGGGGGDVKAGDQVLLIVDGTEYPGHVQALPG